MKGKSTFPHQLSADFIIINGNIITVDNNFSICQAVAIRGDKIIAVGTNEEVTALAGGNTEVLDLHGKTVLPGINDAHIHAALYGGTRPPLAIDVRYPTVKSISDIVNLVAEKVKSIQPGEWIRGYGWYHGYLEECVQDGNRYPAKWDLDPVSPDNPVYLVDFSSHVLWVNSKAMQLAEINRDTSLPSGGEIVKERITGEPNGIFIELPAQGLIMKVVPPWSRLQKREAILTTMRELNSLGITSMTEGALGPGGTGYQGGLMDTECISIYNDLYNEGKLTIRANILLLFGEYGACSLNDLQQIIPKIGFHSGFGNEWLRIGGIKIFADGIPGSKTSWMSREYSDGSNGNLVLPGDNDKARTTELLNMIQYVHGNGFQIGIHATGDRAVDECVNGFLSVCQEDFSELRHYIIHGPFISEETIKRMAKNNIGICVQPSLTSIPQEHMENLLDNEILARQWPLKELLDAGVHVAASSDAPVTYPNWKQGIQAIISRQVNLGGIDQSISRVDAIRAYTIEGAWQDHAENTKGSIEVGKLADFCVIDQDLLTIAVEDIDNINTLMTIIGGKVVFESGS